MSPTGQWTTLWSPVHAVVLVAVIAAAAAAAWVEVEVAGKVMVSFSCMQVVIVVPMSVIAAQILEVNVPFGGGLWGKLWMHRCKCVWYKVEKVKYIVMANVAICRL